jgi:ribonuclease P protein subunit POP4
MDHHPEEFIGSELRVIDARNKSLVGLAGKIIDETKKSFVIRAGTEEKTILKAGASFMINNQSLRGDDLAQRPEDRVKKR